MNHLLNTLEAAKLLGIPASNLIQDRCTNRLGIPFIRVGRLVRYRLLDIESYISENVVIPHKEAQ